MIPENLKYTKTHEWAKVDGGVITVGITDFAAEQLGDIVFVELPAVEATVSQDAAFGVVESVKAAVDLNSPVSGEVTETNMDVSDQLTLISEDPYGKGWMMKVKASDPGELDNLMSAAQYDAFLKSGGH